MQAVQQSSTTYAVVFLLVDESDHVTPLTSLSPTLTLSKNGAAFAACSGSAVEVGQGIYKLADATDFDTLGTCVLKASAAGADPSLTIFRVELSDPSKVGGLTYRIAQNINGTLDGKL